MISRIPQPAPQPEPGPAGPGWYPTPDGLRWWDGQQWGPLAPPAGRQREPWEKWATLGFQLVVVVVFVVWVVPWLVGG